jgi:protein TonB
MAIAITVAPSSLRTQSQEIAAAIYIENVDSTMPKGDQAEALPAAGTTGDNLAEKSNAPQAGDATPVAITPPAVPPTDAAPSEVVIVPLPVKKLPAKKPAPAPVQAIAMDEPADVDVNAAIATAQQEQQELPLEPESQPEAEPEVATPAPIQVQQPDQQQPVPGSLHQTPRALSATTNSGAGHKNGPGGQGSSHSYGIRDASDLQVAPGNLPPNYPERDRLMRNQGTVVFLARVRDDGTVSDARLEKSTQSNTLDMSAREAMKKWRFLPGQEGMVRKGFTFSLDGETQELPARLRR